MRKLIASVPLAISIVDGGLPSVAAAAASTRAIKIADYHCHTEETGYTTSSAPVSRRSTPWPVMRSAHVRSACSSGVGRGVGVVAGSTVGVTDGKERGDTTVAVARRGGFVSARGANGSGAEVHATAGSPKIRRSPTHQHRNVHDCCVSI